MPKKIGLYANTDRDAGLYRTRQVIEILRDLGAVPLADPAKQPPEVMGLPGMTRGSYTDCSVLISLGGDGTFLSAVHCAQEGQIPVIGINLGSIGFLTEIEPDQIEWALPALVNGDYEIRERMQLDVRCYHEDGSEFFAALAINDAVLSRGAVPHIIPILLWIDGEKVETIPSDGVIVSTATGSTGYAMAAGGPIIDPTLQLMLITPICPHTLHNRSSIIAPHSKIRLTIGNHQHTSHLSVDGRKTVAIRRTDTVCISRAEKAARFIYLCEHNFFKRVPDKIRGRGREA
ncbi:MAG: NAD(+)/NADH kinase [Clostridiaceae bacterium]|nr:NAD(+)/NADH kinase [Clostridiaceae bacterium]